MNRPAVIPRPILPKYKPEATDLINEFAQNKQDIKELLNICLDLDTFREGTTYYLEAQSRLKILLTKHKALLC